MSFCSLQAWIPGAAEPLEMMQMVMQVQLHPSPISVNYPHLRNLFSHSRPRTCFKVQLAPNRGSILPSLLAGGGSIHFGLKLRRAVCDRRRNNTIICVREGGRKTALAVPPPRASGWLAYNPPNNCCILVAVSLLPFGWLYQGGHSPIVCLPCGLDTIDRSFRSLNVLIRTPQSPSLSLQN
ncbi:hypothetical protein BJX63DRAFT_38600 [Aspergillus granulosus]|uniref:Uncharacterized protein n=1 Tax=Aspergillus granulosus TaxID=176169 RepID=A0ABR4GYW8_9EURO